MTRLLLIIFLFSFKVTSPELTGNWKVISYEDEIVYYNKITDSISFKDASRKEDAEYFLETAEFMISPLTYNFDNNGNFGVSHQAMGIIASGKYEVDETNKKIIMIDQEGKKETVPFSLDNGILFIEMEMEVGFVKIGLAKSSS
ncbi:hypothetical protein [Cognataquiflexum rubidum]|uniref:hypothetical protein n=1 Tax=Cognataquiflexum rubidum TaxID=2922273 RepID=UPI001F13404B|nr:hypothetical protein [Cognataquiflexum rubidum]MCH6232623.1 hypothetical protein [Cognataquiflexum rubidum]